MNPVKSISKFRLHKAKHLCVKFLAVLVSARVNKLEAGLDILGIKLFTVFRVIWRLLETADDKWRGSVVLGYKFLAIWLLSEPVVTECAELVKFSAIIGFS